MFRLTSGFFMCWFVNTRRNDSEGIFLFADKTPVYAFLRCSFRIIFILLGYVATIAVKAFYDEALRIAFKHCYDFQLISIDWATLFMQSIHRASRPHGMAYFIIARI